MSRKALVVAGFGCLIGLIPLLIVTVIVLRFHASESLFDACLRGNESDVRDWLGRGGDPNFRFDGTALPLAAAVKKGDARIVAILLGNGANPSLTEGCVKLSSMTKNPVILDLLSDYKSRNKGGLGEVCP